MITYHFIENNLLKSAVDQNLSIIPKNTVWIDLLKPTLEEEHFIEQSLTLDVPSPEEMAEIEDSSRFFKTDTTICMIISVLVGSQTQNPFLTELSFVLNKNLVVCAHYENLAIFKSFENDLHQLPSLKTPDTLLMMLLDLIVDRAADILEKLQANLDKLSNRIFDESENQANNSLQSTVKQLGKYNAVLAKLGSSLLSIRRLLIFCKQNVNWLSSEARSNMRSIEQDISSLTEYQAKTSAEINFLLDATLGLINIEQNGIIKVFSIAAVLFLPPTLVGTIYGMNFRDMPEIDWSFGYPLSLGLMVLSALGCYAWFKIKKWL